VSLSRMVREFFQMTIGMIHRTGAAIIAAILLSSGGALAADRTGDIAAGKRVAQRYCGSCHAVAKGGSPLHDAPPFRDLHKRYREGGLPQLLREGMLQPQRMPEEGSPRRHPRMPMAVLEDDEVTQLTAYLKSLEPSRTRRRAGS
jgi:mono/diheme cytochrome c family protein